MKFSEPPASTTQRWENDGHSGDTRAGGECNADQGLVYKSIFRGSHKLSPEERRGHIHARLTPGRVLLLHCDFTTPPKDKFLVLVAVEPDLLFLVINSEISEFIRRREHLSQCQVEIGHDDHPFLRYHSFIDCTQARKIALHDVYEQLEQDFGRLKDDVNPLVREQIIAAVKFAKTLPAKHKANILSALQNSG